MNTIGIVLVSRCSAAVTGVVLARITSGLSATSSLAKLAARSTSAAVHRTSIVKVRPSDQPRAASDS